MDAETDRMYQRRAAAEKRAGAGIYARTDAGRNREIADGYLEAALFTAGVDGGPGQYHADPDKIAALAVFGSSGVAGWIAEMGADAISELETLGLDLARIGHCIHYDREGHGCGFADEGNADVLARAATVARGLGEDHLLQSALMGRYPDAFAD